MLVYRLNGIISAVDSGTPVLTTEVGVVVTVTNENEYPPVFASATYSMSITENSAITTSIGQVVATDVDRPGK